MTTLIETRPLLYVRSIAARRRPHLLGELLIVFVLLRVYDMARARAEVRQGAALQHGQAILDLERWMRIDMELATNLWVTAHQALSLTASYFYQFAHVTVTLTVLGWCWLRRPEIYRAARNALVITNIFGLTVFLLLPVAPPRLLPGEGFVDAVALAGFGATHGGPVAADQYGALPSLHLAWAVWATVIAMRMLASSPLRRLCWLYPVLVTVGVVVTGNHYLLDAVAGTAVALTALAMVQGSETYFPRKARAAAVSRR
ncbi:MAG: phosphatase PAP2 family protein [Frankiaceae bacterium]|nr:phosphatase PAP2 family protein [Frankiaceae bacterium]